MSFLGSDANKARRSGATASIESITLFEASTFRQRPTVADDRRLIGEQIASYRARAAEYDADELTSHLRVPGWDASVACQ